MSGQTITYNGTVILANQPVPFFGKSAEYVQVGERWCQIENWTISGTIIGCEVATIRAAKAALISAFSEAYGSANIAGTDIPLVEVQSLDIDASEDLGGVPYSITLRDYKNFVSGYVINPSDSTTFTENDDGTVDVDRTISANGVRTGGVDSALENAMTFISTRKSSMPDPFFIRNSGGGSSLGYYLVSSEESFNRITNEAKLSQKYRGDSMSSRGGLVHRYTINEEATVSQMTQVSYSGQIETGRYGSLEASKAEYSRFKNSISSAFLINEEITEDPYTNKITYKFSFYKNASGNNFPEIQDDIVISLKEDSGSSLLSASIQGSISANYGCLEQRTDKVKNLLSEIKGRNYNFTLIKSLFEAFKAKSPKPSTMRLNPDPVSESAEMDETNSAASYGAEFNDRYIPSGFRCKNFEAEVKINYALPQFAVKEYHLGGKYICQDLGYVSRESASAQITMDGVNTFAGKVKCKNYALAQLAPFRLSVDQVFESENVYTSDLDSKTESCTAGQTYNKANGFEL